MAGEDFATRLLKIWNAKISKKMQVACKSTNVFYIVIVHFLGVTSHAPQKCYTKGKCGASLQGELVGLLSQLMDITYICIYRYACIHTHYTYIIYWWIYI